VLKEGKRLLTDRTAAEVRQRKKGHKDLETPIRGKRVHSIRQLQKDFCKGAGTHTQAGK